MASRLRQLLGPQDRQGLKSWIMEQDRLPRVSTQGSWRMTEERRISPRTQILAEAVLGPPYADEQSSYEKQSSKHSCVCLGVGLRTLPSPTLSGEPARQESRKELQSRPKALLVKERSMCVLVRL